MYPCSVAHSEAKFEPLVDDAVAYQVKFPLGNHQQ